MNTFPAPTDTPAVTVWVAEWLLNGAHECQPVEGVTLAVSNDGYLTTTTRYGTVQHASVQDLAEYATDNAFTVADWEQALMANAREIEEENERIVAALNERAAQGYQDPATFDEPRTEALTLLARLTEIARGL